MKKIIRVLFLFFILFFSILSYTIATSNVWGTNPPSDIITEPEEIKSHLNKLLSTNDEYYYVYITQYGSRYHSANCQYLTSNNQKVTLNQAVQMGLVPCTDCNPYGLADDNYTTNNNNVGLDWDTFERTGSFDGNLSSYDKFVNAGKKYNAITDREQLHDEFMKLRDEDQVENTIKKTEDYDLSAENIISSLFLTALIYMAIPLTLKISNVKFKTSKGIVWFVIINSILAKILFSFFQISLTR